MRDAVTIELERMINEGWTAYHASQPKPKKRKQATDKAREKKAVSKPAKGQRSLFE